MWKAGCLAAVGLWCLTVGTVVALPLPWLVMPGPTDVVSLIDHLTRKDSTIDVNVKAGQMVSSGKLLIGQLRVNVNLARTSRNWRGKVTSTLRVPAEIRYAIRLTDVQASTIRIEPNHRLVVVQLPKIYVETVTPLLPETQREEVYRGLRFKLIDWRLSTEMQHAMLLHDFQDVARKLGEGNAPLVRDLARAGLRQLLELLLTPAYPGITVRVE
ncbi:MAG: hypothetical protein SNJ82_14635 [Gemmataceae bacterium]